MKKESGIDSYLLTLEHLAQELNESMVKIKQIMQSQNMNPPRRNQPQQQRIECDLSNKYDDPGIAHEPEKIVSENESNLEVEEEEAHEPEENFSDR